MPDHSDPCIELARTQEHVAGLIDWQKTQNGRLKCIEQKLDRLLMWAVGLMGSMLLALVLLGLNLLIKRI